MSSISPDAQPTSVETDPDGEERHPSREAIFEVLSNRRRRYVLHYLKQLEDGEAAPLSAIASHVAAWEQGQEVPDITYEDRKSVQTSLYQTHLPKLAEKNLIEYDPESKLVTRRETSDTIEVYLEKVAEEELPWSTVFVGLSGTICLLAIATRLDVYLIGSFEPAALFLIASSLFLGASAWFTLEYRSKFRLGNDDPPPE